MSKLWNYLVMIAGLSILLALAGIKVPGVTNLFNNLGWTVGESVSSTQSSSTFWTFLFGTGGLLAGIGFTSLIGIGTFVFNKDKSYIMIPFLTTVSLYWGAILISVVNSMKGDPVFGVLLGLVLLPLSLGFIVSIGEWFLGQG